MIPAVESLGEHRRRIRKHSMHTVCQPDPIDPAGVADPKNYSIKVWGLKRSQNYGSPHVNEKPLTVAKATLSADGKTVRLDIPDLVPTWGMEIRYRLKGVDGRSITGVIHNSIHEIGK